MTRGRGSRLGHFEIVAPLGAGGMGEVYRARDPRLGRDVAIKVLPAAFATEPDRLHRFEQEARATAALDHPNILAIYDVGTHEGEPYIVEQLLEGEPLRKRLDSGALPVNKAIEIAVAISNGLAAAHAKGIVHRDLKPENVFITTDGMVKVLDFGLAKLTAAPEGTDLSSLPTASSPHTVLGTVGYMAPEQVRGQPTDHRADIFALGCVLYEMLAGERAFSGATCADTLSAILSCDPRPLSGAARARAVSPTLEAIVGRCLEKRPEDRFSSAHDLALALAASSWPQHVPPGPVPVAARPNRRLRLALAAAALVLVAVGITVGLSVLRKSPTSPLPGEPTRIAVLPFENVGAPEDAYFADGMTDEVRGKLSALSGLAVIARSSAIEYRGTTKPARQVAEELGAPYLLTATVRWQKGGTGESRIRVTPELVEISAAGVATTRWQDSFDAELADVFRVQAEIATRVAGALQVVLDAGEQRRLGERPTSSLAAYDAYLHGQEISGDMSRMRTQALRRAIAHYEQATALDPGFALAWAQLARARAAVYQLYVASPAMADGAREAAERAIRLAPDLPEARLAMGNYHLRVTAQPRLAEEELKQGLARAPRQPSLLTGLANAEQRLGRWEDALGHLEQARALDPRSVFSEVLLSRTLLRLRRYPEALVAYDRGLALDPANLSLIDEKAQVFLARGDLAGARAVLAAAAAHVGEDALVVEFAWSWDLYWVLDPSQQDRLLGLTPAAFDDNRAAWALTLTETCALRGDRNGARRYAEEARRAYAAQLADSPGIADRRVLYALALAYLGRRDEAIREGERALAALPISRDAFQGTYDQHQLVRVYILLGEQERALDLLEPLLTVPYFLSPGWLSIDPNFAPLRGNPRFERLLGAKG